MAIDIRDMRDKRGKILHDAKALLETVMAEGRDMTDEEQANYDKAFDDQHKLKGNIDKYETLQAEEKTAAANYAGDMKPEAKGKAADPKALRAKAFASFIKHGALDKHGREIFGALQSDSDTAGGFLVPDEQFSNALIKAVDDQVYIRQRATVMAVNNADGLGVPSLDNDPADANWTSELATGSEDSTMSFGKRELKPNPLAKLIKVSNKLINNSVMDTESLVRARLAYKFAITEEKGFMTGTGANQPLGVFTASNDGIGTGRDVSTGNTTTAIGADNLVETKYALKGAYRTTAEWLMHRDALKQVSKLKDGEGQYLWRPGLVANDPDRILNMPVNESEYAPNTFTTGQYVGVLGAFSNYWIADSVAMQLQRLVELYAATNQIGLIGRLETDGMPVLSEAFARMTLA